MKKVSLALFLTTAIAFQGSALADNKEQCKKKGKACKNIRAKVDTNKNGLIDKDEVSGWAQILADKYADKKSSPSQKKMPK